MWARWVWVRSPPSQAKESVRLALDLRPDYNFKTAVSRSRVICQHGYNHYLFRNFIVGSWVFFVRRSSAFSVAAGEVCFRSPHLF